MLQVNPATSLSKSPKRQIENLKFLGQKVLPGSPLRGELAFAITRGAGQTRLRAFGGITLPQLCEAKPAPPRCATQSRYLDQLC